MSDTTNDSTIKRCRRCARQVDVNSFTGQVRAYDESIICSAASIGDCVRPHEVRLTASGTMAVSR